MEVYTNMEKIKSMARLARGFVIANLVYHAIILVGNFISLGGILGMVGLDFHSFYYVALGTLGLAGIFFLIWLYRAMNQLSLLGVEGLVVTPGWAVGSYFVPVINFILPITSMSQLWRGSQPAGTHDSWKGLKTPSYINTWWICYLIACFFPYLLGLAYSDLMWDNNFQLIGYLYQVPHVLLLISGYLLLKLMQEITASQEEMLLGFREGGAQGQTSDVF
ncbi:MAG: DUF4328 domain-containing protein [Bacteroidia bacterium]|nr:DUF4328 domain-containing protein [Bacteroidia bacterium]